MSRQLSSVQSLNIWLAKSCPGSALVSYDGTFGQDRDDILILNTQRLYQCASIWKENTLTSELTTDYGYRSNMNSKQVLKLLINQVMLYVNILAR